MEGTEERGELCHSDADAAAACIHLQCGSPHVNDGWVTLWQSGGSSDVTGLLAVNSTISAPGGLLQELLRWWHTLMRVDTGCSCSSQACQPRTMLQKYHPDQWCSAWQCGQVWRSFTALEGWWHCGYFLSSDQVWHDAKLSNFLWDEDEDGEEMTELCRSIANWLVDSAMTSAMGKQKPM